MGMLGNKLQSAYTTTVKDTRSGDGSTTVFTLSKPSRTNDVDVFVENVRQEPTVAYSVSGTTLTFTEAPASGTDNIYVIHRVQASQSLTVNTDDITDGAITSAKLAAGAVTDPTPAVVSGVDNTATDFFSLPRGTTAQRPATAQNGYLRFNTTENYIEEYQNGQWSVISNLFEASGGTETTQTIDGTVYKIHTFTQSGTFTVDQGSTTVEYLVIAGGGGGGRSDNGHQGGGGGAGGYRCSVSGESSGDNSTAESAISVSRGSYNVVVGGGGNGSTNTGTRADNGNDSEFGTIVSIGGGGGGAGSDGGSQRNGLSGGSGGGSASSNQFLVSGGSGTQNQGGDGGSPTSIGNGHSGEGGGAGGDGSDAQGVSMTVSSGGPGLSSSIDGTATTRAAGGGVQGSGAMGSHFQNAAANSGTGGIGGYTHGYSANGANGGSGVVIIRYAV